MSLLASQISHALLLVTNDAVAAARLMPSFRSRGFHVVHQPCGDVAIQSLRENAFAVVLLCACAPGREGIRTLVQARRVAPDARVIVMTEFRHVETAVEAMRLGAFDYVLEPLELSELHMRVSRALEDRQLRAEVAHLRAHTNGIERRMVGESPVMRDLLEQISRVAALDVPVLITGETGVGKELVAQRIHQESHRISRPFMTISCAALSESLLESELFGHVRGSFTGAVSTRRGLVEEAEGGTLFLDEIETLTLMLQAKLLRLVEQRTIQPVGGRHDVRVDFRLITASNTPLEPRVARREFRQDLLFRLNVFPVHIAPLRQRSEDVPLLAEYFRDSFAKETGLPAPPFDSGSMAAMIAYAWPGNVRELRHCVERAMILWRGDGPLFVEVGRQGRERARQGFERALAEGWTLAQLERAYIAAVMASARGNRSRAARMLGINRSTLYEKLARPTSLANPVAPTRL